MAKESEETRILFADPQEMEKRRNHIKAFKNIKERPLLVEDRAEKIRNVCEMMILEGFSDELIDYLLSLCPDPGSAETLDFLHMAVLVMGEGFVRENLAGKVLSGGEACRLLRESYHEDQMKPYRQIYENLDERIRAALEGEAKVAGQIEILKLKSEHAAELYEQRMANAKIQFECDLAMEKREGQLQKERFKERISFLESQLGKEREKGRRQKEEYEMLLKEAALLFKSKQEGAKKIRPSRKKSRADREEKEILTDNNPMGPKTPDRRSADDERRAFCLCALGNRKFTGEQLDLVLPCLMDETIPLSVLEHICRPDLPVQNLRSLIRYIKGGNKEDGKE